MSPLSADAEEILETIRAELAQWRRVVSSSGGSSFAWGAVEALEALLRAVGESE